MKHRGQTAKKTVRRSRARSAAVCAAGVLLIGGTALFMAGCMSDIPTDNASESASADSTEWQTLDLRSRISDISGMFYCDLIPNDAYLDITGYAIDPNDTSEYEHMLEYYNSVYDSEHKYRYPVPPIVSEDSDEYRFLRFENAEYRGDELRLIYKPFLSKAENFTEADPDFVKSVPELTVNVGLTDEYTAEGTLEIADGRIVMTFRGIRDPEGLVKQETFDRERLSDRFRDALDEQAEYGGKAPEVLYTGLFDVKLSGFKTVYMDDDCFCVDDFTIGETCDDTEEISYIYSDSYRNRPLVYERYTEMPHAFDNDFALIVHKDGSIHLNSHYSDEMILSFASSDYIDPPYTSVTADSGLPVFFLDGILYKKSECMDESDTRQMLWLPKQWRKTHDVLHLPDGYCTINFGWLIDEAQPEKILLGDNCGEFYDTLLSYAAIELDPQYTASESYFCLLEDKEKASQILHIIENAGEYGSGDVDADIANAEPAVPYDYFKSYRDPYYESDS